MIMDELATNLCTVKNKVLLKHLLGCFTCHLRGAPLGCSDTPW